MNYHMVKRLILKDWYLNRWVILASIPAGLVSLGIALTGSKAAILIGLILLLMIVMGVGAHLGVSTILNERKEQTLAFVMSLPISYREYTASKILGNLIIFFIPWLALVFSCFALIAVVPAIPHGLVPYVAIMAMEILLSTCFVTVVALMSESQGWTIVAIMIGNLALIAFGYYAAHIQSIAAGLWEFEIRWTPAASTLLLAEFTATALLLGLTFHVQSRKKDFL